MSADASGEQVRKERQQENDVKLGLLLVSLGITQKEKLFPNGEIPTTSSPLKSIGEKGVFSPPSRNNHSSGRGTTAWYNPLSWFSRKDSSAKQLSAIDSAHNHSRAHQHDAEASALHVATEMNHTERSSATSSSSTPQVQSTEPQQPATDTLVALAKKAAIDAAAKQNRKAPEIDFRQLSDAEISRLLPSTQQDRERVLKLEETIHSMIDAIEKTKHQYLTPSRAIECEAQVDAVVECFHRVNLQLSVMPESEGILKRSRVALNCGVPVDRLRECTNRVVSDYALQ
jgi:hypothetical protein